MQNIIQQYDALENGQFNNLLEVENNGFYNSIVGISQKLKFIVVHNLLKKYADQYSKVSQIVLLPNWNKQEYYYKNPQQLTGKQQQAINQFNEKISKTIVYSLHCLNFSEKKAKINFLWRNLDKILNLLNTQIDNIFIGEIIEPKECYQQFKKNIFILLLDQKIGNNFQLAEIMKKQIQLNIFVEEQFIKKFQVYNIKKPKLSRLELKLLSKDMTQALKNSVNIKIGHEKYDFHSFEKNINIQITQYDNSIHIDNQFIKEFQDRSQNVFRASLKDKKLFSEFVLKQPFFQKNLLKYEFTQDGIKFKGSHNQIQQMQAVVSSSIKSVKTQSIFLQMNNLVSQFYHQIQNQKFHNTLTNLFMNMTKNAYMLNVVNIKNNIEVEVFLIESLNNDIVKLENILNMTLEQLRVIQITNETLATLEVTLEEFENKYFAFSYQKDQQIYSLMHSKFEDQIKAQLDSKKTQSNMYYKALSKIYAFQIIKDYQNKEIPQKPEILKLKLNEDKQTILIECAAKNLDILQSFEKHEKKLQNILTQTNFNISKMKCKYLLKNCQKEIQEISERMICEINFDLEEYETPTLNPGLIQKQQKNTKTFITFGKKSVIFSKNLVTDIFIKLGEKHPLDKKVKHIASEKLPQSALTVKHFLNFFERNNQQMQKIGVLYDEIKNIFSIFLEVFMKPEFTKANQLIIFLDENTNQVACEQQLIQSLSQYISNSFQEFQWQWAEGKQYFDYDDAFVNEQIELAYQNFLKNNQKNEAIINFSCSYTPGTHTIDLNKQTILDHATGNTKSLKIKDGIYYIAGEQQDDMVNQFIKEKIAANKYQFTIFLKRYKISFKSNIDIYQVNLETLFRRKIRRVSKKDQYFQFLCDFTKKNQPQSCETLMDGDQAMCKIKYFSQINDQMQQMNQQDDKQEQIQQALNTVFQKYLVKFDITIPNLNDQVFFNFLSFLQNNSVDIQGDMEPGCLLQITSTNKNQLKIIEILQYFSQFPNDWSHLSYSNLYQFEQVTIQNKEINDLIPSHYIKGLQSVQNFDIWMKYQKVKQSLQNQDEILLFYGNKNVCPQEEIANLRLYLETDPEIGPFVKCGKNISYIKDNFCQMIQGEKQIIICQVLIGNPIELKQEYIISDNIQHNYLKDNYYYIKRDRIYPKYVVTLTD